MSARSKSVWVDVHDELRFSYGDDFEHFGPGFHRIPVTENVWIAGVPELASDIFICGSAMDALSFGRVSPHYAFVALGALPAKSQLENLPDRRFHLLFPKDDLGAVCDLKVAAWLRKQAIKITLVNDAYQVLFRNQSYHLEKLSLNALEKVSGYRFGIRTHKPKNAITWTSALNQRLFSPLSRPAPS
jgi:hypothetical protein